MPEPVDLLKLNAVSKRYESLDGGPAVPVLEALSFTVKHGESLAVVGPSGCGKSTLLNIIGTLDRPSSGTVEFEGQDLGRLSDIELAGFRNSKIGFIFQSHHLLPQCSVLENVLVPTLAGGGKGSADAPERATRLLERVGLKARLSHRPGQLSGGERQRVAVVRALINRPKLLLADEPTGALDRASAQNLAQLLGELNREEKVTLIVVTHAPDLAAAMGRQLEMRDGKFVNA